MAYITINADDFGFTQGVTEGIYRSIAEGIVTSTAAMACVDGARENIQAFMSITPGAIGAHLQLTDGRPVLPPEEIPSLVDKEGRFYSKAQFPWDLSPAEVLAEWKAQLQRLRGWGLEPVYLDTHHHVHLRSQVLPAMAQLAKELSLPVRGGAVSTVKMLRYAGVVTPDVSLLEFFGEELTWKRMMEMLQKAIAKHGPEAVIELSCHPGISTPELEKLSHYTRQREEELTVFLQSYAREQLEEIGVHLIRMNEVSRLRPARPDKTISL